MIRRVAAAVVVTLLLGGCTQPVFKGEHRVTFTFRAT